ncbi:MAG: protein kinase, partial [Myxococcales bacterium]|nr:protein kinase [Myxococcales bacterium]
MTALDATAPLGPLHLGAVVGGRYRVEALLGAGGMGTVYRAYDAELDEVVALKVLRVDDGLTPDALQRFRREVKLARRILHPAVARTFDIGMAGELRFLTMELISGISLQERMREPIPLPETLRIVGEVARGLCAAHSAGVVHRDLKPDNVMLAQERIAITDFGIARLAATPDGALVTSGAVVGTPAYMAPEQLENGVVDGRADVYALGIVLYELVSGRLPFNGDSPIAMAAARLVAPAPALAAAAPPRLSELVRAMLARHREERPDAASVAHEVDVLRGVSQESVVATVAPLSLVVDVPVREGATFVSSLEAATDMKEPALDLERAIGDALVRKGVRVAEVRDGAEHTVTGDLRRSAGRVRARLRVLARSGTTTGAEQFDGDVGDPFALEDAVATAVVAAVSARGARSGDLEGAALERLQRARELYESSALPDVRAAQAELEQLLAAHPRSASVMAALAESLLRTWGHSGAASSEQLMRAEELALRSLDASPNADAYAVLGGIRATLGRYAEAWRTLEETVRRAPLHPPALQRQASILADTGHPSEAIARLDLALRRAPKYALAHLERVRVLALMGEVEEAERALRVAEATVGIGPVAPVLARLPFLFEDRAMAQAAADRFADAPVGGAWEQAAPFLLAYAARAPMPADASAVIDRLSSLPHAGARFKCMIHAILAETLCAFGHHEDAMSQIERLDAARTIDLLWFDRCRTLGPLRTNERFLEIRA